MPKITSSIFMLSTSDHRRGQCDICGLPIVMIKYHDTSTGQRFGECCKRQMVAADQFLQFMRLDRPTVSNKR